VHVVRGPNSDPQHGVALCARKGAELVWIDDCRLPDGVRSAVNDELAEWSFATIRQIYRVSIANQSLPGTWKRRAHDVLPKSDDDVRRLDNHRALVIDAHGIRY